MKETDDLNLKRTRAKALLQSRPETVIVVVTHNGFLRTLLGDSVWSKNGRSPNGFTNGEIRRVVMTADGEFHQGEDSGDGGTSSGLVTLDGSFNDELEAVGGLD